MENRSGLVFLLFLILVFAAWGCARKAKSDTIMLNPPTSTGSGTSTDTSTSTGTDTSTDTSTSTGTDTSTGTSTGSDTSTSTSTSTGTETYTSTVTGYPGANSDLRNYGDQYITFYPGVVQSGNAFHAQCMVQNWGSEMLGPVTVNFYLSENTIISPADYYLGNSTVNLIAMGSFWTFKLDCTVPMGMPKGVYYLGYIIDPYDTVQETDETNNVAFNPDNSVLINTDGMTTAVTFYVRNEEYWTGTIWSSDYAKIDGDLHMEYTSSTVPRSSGWVKFDVSELPAGAIPTKITFYYYADTVFEPYDALRLYSISVDPVSSTGSEIWSGGSYTPPEQSIQASGLISSELDICTAGAVFKQTRPYGFYALRFCGF